MVTVFDWEVPEVFDEPEFALPDDDAGVPPLVELVVETGTGGRASLWCTRTNPVEYMATFPSLYFNSA